MWLFYESDNLNSIVITSYSIHYTKLYDEHLKEIVYDTLQFDCPLVKVNDSIYSLELFHGPTLAFKDRNNFV